MIPADYIDQHETDLRHIIPKRKKNMKPYMRGFEAYHDGKNITNNAYSPLATEYYEWKRGWLDAKKKEKGNDQ